MKNPKKIILGVILSGILLIIAFHFVFGVGMFETNRSKSLNDDIVSACADNIKISDKDFILKDLDLYYKQGKIFANIYLENNLSLEDSKIVVRSLKEFFLQDKINIYLEETHSKQLSIYAVIHSKDNTYNYNSMYYLNDDDSLKINNYRLWNLTKSSGETIKSMNID